MWRVAASKVWPQRAKNGASHAFGHIYRQVMRDKVVPNVPIYQNTFFPPNQPKASRSYRALLGWTLPSGVFRTLAESNLVSTPRTGPSPDPAHRRLPFNAPLAEIRGALGADAEKNPGPWSTEPFDADAPIGSRRRRGGASDAFRPPSAGKLGR